MRTIRNHVSQRHKEHINTSPDITTDNDEDNSPEDTFFDVNDSCRDIEDEEVEGIVYQLDMENNNRDNQHLTTDTPTKSGNQTMDLEDFNVFSNFTPNVYFWK